MKPHANSQITDQEATRLLQAALNSPEHRGSRQLVQGHAVDGISMLCRYTTQTPEGALHEVTEERVLDGEVFAGWAYRDESDALAVWAHITENPSEA